MKFELWFCRRESEVHKKSSAFVIKFQIAIPQRLFIASRASKYILEGKSENFGKQTNFCHYWFIETTNDDFQHINSIIYFWIRKAFLERSQWHWYNGINPDHVFSLIICWIRPLIVYSKKSMYPYFRLFHKNMNFKCICKHKQLHF